MKPNIGTALRKLGYDEFVIEGAPESQEELNTMLKFVTGADASGNAILSSDHSAMTHTWDDIKAKYDELVAEYPTNILRIERDKLLEETDFWELPSQQPMNDERANYRQALRDITETYSSLDEVVWPEKPE